ncbi:helix-turn-helix domain-containing protein [Micromonospora sp. NPDC049048]|uniref:helix-turn-helix domain-containing protein n=1 Tax=Micromonospora sp. NPDC049048 TaxID=3364263 RepID=UPI0037185BB4
MALVDIRPMPLSQPPSADSRLWQSSRVRHAGAEGGTYRDDVPPRSQDQRVVMFGAFVKRALTEARERGLSIEMVEERTGVGRATIYRWTRAENPNPQREKVLAFCEGLGVPVTTASQILGWDGSRQPTAPEPIVDPDIRAIMRKLNDPNVSAAEKTTIRATLRHLARE